MKNTKKNISIEKLHPFENHPYKVQDNEEMDALAESIKLHGVVSPIIVRPLENTTDEYEIISGHRRVMASRKAGITEIPAVMIEEKANQREMFKVPMERIRQYVPNANAKQAEDFVLKACEYYRKFLIRQRNRDER